MSNTIDPVDKLEHFVLTEKLESEQDTALQEIYLSIQRLMMQKDEQIQMLTDKVNELELDLDEKKTIIWNDPTLRKQIAHCALSAAHGNK